MNHVLFDRVSAKVTDHQCRRTVRQQSQPSFGIVGTLVYDNVHNSEVGQLTPVLSLSIWLDPTKRPSFSEILARLERMAIPEDWKGLMDETGADQSEVSFGSILIFCYQHTTCS